LNGDSIRVVLADDVAVYRQLTRALLEADGRFEIVAEAGDGLEAIQACESEQPDVILLDLAMPRLDGLQAIPRIKACSPRTSIIVLSGFARDQLERQALAAGANAYLEKGMDIGRIASAIAGSRTSSAVRGA
jgi:CheY-like chemotaxis protein